MIADIRKKAWIGITSVSLLLFLLSIFGTSALLNLQGITTPNAHTLWLSRIAFWLVVALLWLYAKQVEKRDMLQWKDVNYGWLFSLWHLFLILVVIFAAMMPVSIVLSLAGEMKVSPKLTAMKSMFQASKPLLFFVALTAGVTEEIVFRGYLQPRLETLLKNPYLSILITATLFALLHLGYGTVQNVVGPFVIGVVFSAYYWKFRNIKILMVCHFLIDVIALVALVGKK